MVKEEYWHGLNGNSQGWGYEGKGKDVYKWNYREGFGGKNTVWGGVEEVSNLIQLWII